MPGRCNSCQKPVEKPYVHLSRSDGTGTIWHWDCVYIIDRSDGGAYDLGPGTPTNFLALWHEWVEKQTEASI